MKQPPETLTKSLLRQDFLGGMLHPVHPEGLAVFGLAPIDRGTYYEYRCPDAEFLLRALDIEASMYRLPVNGEVRPFLFRGHSDARYRLEPSVFRDDALSQVAPFIEGTNLSGHIRAGVNRYELDPFCHFLEGIDALGMFIEPESHQILEAHRRETRLTELWAPGLGLATDPRHMFPTRDQLRSLALAQHFGIKTRLLDWTRNPYIALFFATEKIRKTTDHSGQRIGIWAIPRLLLDVVQIFKYLEIVEVPRFQNPNIVAQQGLFTSHVPPLRHNDGAMSDLPSDPKGERFQFLDEYLMDAGGDEFLEQLLAEVTGKPMHFTLSCEEIAPIRRKLDQLNITWASLMPNLEGVTLEAKRRMEMVHIRDF